MAKGDYCNYCGACVVSFACCCEDSEPQTEDRDRLIAELAKEREQARAAREQTISYAEQKTADWKGIADVLKVKLDDAALRVAWLERELTLEKAKNRKRGL